MFSSAPLESSVHNVAPFDCGELELDTWLKSHASNSDAKRITRTFVWCVDGSVDVVAYYSLMGHKIVREGLPAKLARGNPYEIPAVLLARLALDCNLHGEGHGGEVLADALMRVVAATEIVGARFVVVDAVHEKAATFYEHYGFLRIPGSSRLFRKISSIDRDVNPGT